jgi:hypothetical protein
MFITGEWRRIAIPKRGCEFYQLEFFERQRRFLDIFWQRAWDETRLYVRRSLLDAHHRFTLDVDEVSGARCQHPFLGPGLGCSAPTRTRRV